MRLIDSFQRAVGDLRISVTDRCNFRCTYCMPAEGMVWLPREQILSFEEITRVAAVFVERFEVDGIRLTGGEPTVRAHLPVLVEQLRRLTVPAVAAHSAHAGGPADLAMTTNATMLRSQAADLRAAGLARVNISLDTLRADRFAAMTRRDDLARVLDGIDAALETGFDSVKLNAVVQRGVNDDEIPDLARFARERGIEVRFIEFMPLDADGRWSPGDVVTQSEIVAAIDRVFPVEQVPSSGPAPANRWRYRDGAGLVGVIPSVSAPFCGDCDRVRLTAEGQLRTCLFATTETDLRGPLRAGASDDELAELIRAAVWGKWAGHQINQVTFVRPRRTMSQIGG